MSENYIPLYRKYRPQTLDSLVGQEHIKKTLASAIELGKIAHAFLFTGPRGTGKTSTARILAKSLNCVNGPTLHPCGECESCKDITNSIPIDVIEIDAASNRKVEDTQNILEKIQYVPVHGKYKIYIIDEVHMLTNHAFNALLKTLEEPPENVIFILATTEVHKVLDTIKSRCQRFDFRRITTDDIVKHLRYISDQEKINISDDALFSIAKNSAGGMRDSISLLDQLSLLGASKQITPDDVNAILGRISFDTLNKLSEKIISSSPNEAIEILNDIYNSGNEPLQILTNLAEYFKNLLIVKNCKKDLLSELTGLNEPQIDTLIKQKDLLETQQIVFLLDKITYYIKEIKLASNQHLWLEVGIIDLANMTENTTLLDMQNRIQALENGGTPQIPHHNIQPEVVTRPAPIPPAEPSETKVTEAEKHIVKKEPKKKSQETEEFTPPPMSKKSDGSDISTLWQTLLANIASTPTRSLLSQMAIPLQISAEGIIIAIKSDEWVKRMNEPSKKQLITDAADKVLGQEGSNVTIKLAKANDSVIKTEAAPAKTEQTDKQKTTTQKQKIVSESIVEKKEKTTKDENNKYASDQEKMVLELFDGRYVE